jgi:hypothetical protein
LIGHFKRAVYSSAIDAGDCAAGLEINDQRGVARPQGPACNIGAIEVQVPVAANYAYSTSAGKTLVQRSAAARI